MTRRLVLALAGTGVLLTAVPVLAAQDRGAPAHVPSSAAAEQEALGLLEQAARVGRGLTYSGTQYLASWRERDSEASLVELHHDPVRGSVAVDDPQAAVGEVTSVLDPRVLHLLGQAYALRVAGAGQCAGRAASIVEATRDGVVAGRFWVDRDSGLLLRREVFDGDGRRVRSMAFLDLAVHDRAPGSTGPAAAVLPVTGAERPAPAALDRLRRAGWHVPEQLPEGFQLFETRHDGAVLHLAYTDGLSTLSLFSQAGELGSEPMPGFEPEQVGGRDVWVRRSAPERVVWAGGERVWTLVSDAPDPAVRAAVTALPHDDGPDGGLLARLGRGLSRLGAMANPFS